ncbi:MAG: alpha/beta hydrolase [Actinomycetota bacterium]|nr:alpha/beta hydrolase [Actinomycetota bacterium]
MMKLLRWLFGGWVVWRLFGPIVEPRFKPPQEHPWRLTGRTVFVGDEEFMVRQAGAGEHNPILLIHGLAGSSLGEWYQIGQKLATDRRVIMIDHRNHGMAPQATDRYEIEDVADDLASVLDVLDMGAVDVVGYSMGGAIAQALVHRHPGRVSRLALISTFAAHPDEMRWIRQVGAFITRAWERFTGLGTPEARTGYLLATGAVKPEHGRWLWHETHRRDPNAGTQATLALLRFDSRPWVGRMGVETMVVVSGKDLLVPPPWQYELAGLIPDAKIVEIPDARHEVVWSHPDRILDELNAFFD